MKTKKTPAVDIVIVTYDALPKLKTCLDSLRRHTPAAMYRLYIINNASADGTREYLDALRIGNGEVYHLPANLGFSGGANFAVKKLRADYAVFLDDDAQVTKGWLKGLLRHFKKTNRVGMAAGKMVYPDGRIFFCEGRLNPLRTLFIRDVDRGQADYVKEVDLVAGACFLVPRKILHEIGRFDEKFFPAQFEDFDYCLRVRQAGYKIIYDGSVVIIHDNLFRASGKYKLNEARFKKKWARLLEKRTSFADSHPADQMMSKACRALESGRDRKAIELTNQLKAVYPKFVEPWVPALAHIRLKHYREALPFLKELFARNPSSFSARNYLTLCLRQLGAEKTARGLTEKMFACVTRNIKLKRKQA